MSFEPGIACLEKYQTEIYCPNLREIIKNVTYIGGKIYC